jgi:hypothetical protein
MTRTGEWHARATAGVALRAGARWMAGPWILRPDAWFLRKAEQERSQSAPAESVQPESRTDGKKGRAKDGLQPAKGTSD